MASLEGSLNGCDGDALRDSSEKICLSSHVVDRSPSVVIRLHYQHSVLRGVVIFCDCGWSGEMKKEIQKIFFHLNTY